MTENEALTNQTQFSSEEPILQDEKGVVIGPNGTPKKSTAKWAYLGAAAAVLLIMIGIMMIMPRRPAVVSQILQMTPTPSPTAIQTGLSLRISNLKQDLRAVDPNRQDLPFPPVDLTISLDKPTVR